MELKGRLLVGMEVAKLHGVQRDCSRNRYIGLTFRKVLLDVNLDALEGLTLGLVDGQGLRDQRGPAKEVSKAHPGEDKWDLVARSLNPILCVPDLQEHPWNQNLLGRGRLSVSPGHKFNDRIRRLSVRRSAVGGHDNMHSFIFRIRDRAEVDDPAYRMGFSGCFTAIEHRGVLTGGSVYQEAVVQVLLVSGDRL